MKIFKIAARLIGIIALIAGVSSCKDDDANIECCTFSGTDTYNGVTTSYTVSACSDGKLTYVEDGDTDVDTWKGDYGSWAEVKAQLTEYGAKCS